jgi:hypothetical protein
MVQVEVALQADSLTPKHILAYERLQELEIRIWYADYQKSTSLEKPVRLFGCSPWVRQVL